MLKTKLKQSGRILALEERLAFVKLPLDERRL
jgi:hypothetical protein